MTLETKNRYVDVGSYDRGRERYKKRLNRWKNASAVGIIIMVLGGGIVAACERTGDALPFFIGVIGGALAGLGIFVSWFARFGIRRYHIEDFVYQIAVHFMRVMKIPQPEKVLALNPSYLEAYEQVLVVAAGMKLENVGGRHPDPNNNFYYFVDPGLHRIASLVLRDEYSLTATPHLVFLTSDRKITDYDALVYLLDGDGSTAEPQ